MPNDSLSTATTAWQAIQANGVDITDGTFTIINRQRGRVELLKSSSAPAVDAPGAAFMLKMQDSCKYDLGAGEKLYCKTYSDTIELGVISA